MLADFIIILLVLVTSLKDNEIQMAFSILSFVILWGITFLFLKIFEKINKN
jgi:hypothetical protein